MLNNVKKWKRCVVASFYLDLAQLPGELFNPKDNWKKTVSGNFTTFSIWYGCLLVLRALPDITSAPEVRKFFYHTKYLVGFRGFTNYIFSKGNIKNVLIKRGEGPFGKM